ncbi:hypothetical protein SNE25_20975 [Mucilaginibacter sabulilitoris]|uniref:Uncharacterized protein n=1 Tax=Mucilaginibacter sabulilitoris TaxID=1173583 RepID=A0ABZ0TGC6_9SPHI|nr:hypothetical protein [Mucilaginibacter sabulilitoris]WPU91794.1 hypothetical protein SNE25_20975 [Mucilaginibacter sabulilitoris]
MKNSFDMVTDVRSLINVAAVTTLLEGGNIYPDARPTGRAGKIDIVVNALGINNLPFQKGTPNINVYAPNVKTTQPDGSVQYLPNYVKLNVITKAIIPLVEAQYRETFNTQITDPGTLLKDADGNWFVSMQLGYESYNKYYNNF